MFLKINFIIRLLASEFPGILLKMEILHFPLPPPLAATILLCFSEFDNQRVQRFSYARKVETSLAVFHFKQGIQEFSFNGKLASIA